MNLPRTIYRLSLLAIAALFAACKGDVEPTLQGWLHVESPARDTAAVVSRAATAEPDYLISVERGGNMVMAPIRYSSLSGNIALSAATDYTLLAESCTKTEAEITPTPYGQPRYAGTKDFVIEPNEQTRVKVSCSMANAAFAIVEDESFYYTSYTVRATVGNRTLDFTNEEQMGYFNVDEDTQTTTLSYEVTAIDPWGNTGTGSGIVTLRAKTLSNLHLKGRTLGQLGLEVTYDDTFTPIVTQIVIEP